MKNGKRPTLQQKLIMKSHGLQPDNWLVVKNTTEHLEVVSRIRYYADVWNKLISEMDTTYLLRSHFYTEDGRTGKER